LTEVIRRKNFLILEGRSLATGKRGQLTPAEWLYLSKQVEDDLLDGQVATFTSFEKRIRGRYPQLEMDTVAL